MRSILLMILVTLTDQAYSQSERDLASVVLEKEAATAAYRKAEVLRNSVDSFIIFHNAVKDNIIQKSNEIKFLSDQYVIHFEVDSKTLIETKKWAETVLGSAIDGSINGKSTSFQDEWSSYKYKCNNLETSKIFLKVDSLYNDANFLIGTYKKRSESMISDASINDVFKKEIGSNVRYFDDLGGKFIEGRRELHRYNSANQVCVTVNSFAGILETIEVYRSLAKEMNTDGLKEINSSITSFLSRIDSDERSIEVTLFIKKYLASLEASVEDQERRGQLEKLTKLSNRLDAVSTMLRAQARQVYNAADRDKLVDEINAVTSRVITKYLKFTQDNQSINTVLFRRLRYLMASLAKKKRSGTLSNQVEADASSLGIDLKTNKIDFKSLKSFEELHTLAIKVADLESKIGN